MNEVEFNCRKKQRVSCPATRLHRVFLTASLGLVSCAFWPATVLAQTFTSTGTITISNGVAASTPYPSPIYVGTNGAASLPGVIQKVTISLHSLTCQTPEDLSLMLVAPSGNAYEFMSFAGGTSSVIGVTLTFDDNAGSLLSQSGLLFSGTYKPTSYFCESGSTNKYPSPAPQVFNSAQPCGTTTLASEFNSLNPNGTWQLFLANRLLGSAGTLGSWSLNFTMSPPDLSVTCSHTGSFCQGEAGAQYSVIVHNAGPGPSGGSVAAMVVDTFPAGLMPIAASGSGWNCVISNQTVTCTQTNQTAAGTSYPPITLAVNVATNAPASLTNTVVVSGSSDDTPGNDTAVNPTAINPLPAATITPSPLNPCPNSGGNQASAPAGASSYSWTITNGKITSATNLQTITYTAGSPGSVGLTLRISNAAGCTATNSISVPTFVDTIPPTVTCSSNITVTAFGHCPVVVNFNISASDNCTLSSLVATPASGSAFPVGTNTVTVVATDGSGNTNSCTFKVTVLPGSAPRLAAVLAGTNVILSWPSTAGCYALQFSPALLSSPSSNLWTNYAGPLTTNAGSILVTNRISVGSRFYRLALFDLTQNCGGGRFRSTQVGVFGSEPSVEECIAQTEKDEESDRGEQSRRREFVGTRKFSRCCGRDGRSPSFGQHALKRWAIFVKQGKASGESHKS